MTDSPGTLSLDDPAFRRALRELGEVHDDLAERQQQLARTVHGLLGGGWTGVAAQQYAEGWADWETGCGRVLEGLAGMRAAMGWAVGGLHAADDDRSAALGRLDARLAEMAGASGGAGGRS